MKKNPLKVQITPVTQILTPDLITPADKHQAQAMKGRSQAAANKAQQVEHQRQRLHPDPLCASIEANTSIQKHIRNKTVGLILSDQAHNRENLMTSHSYKVRQSQFIHLAATTRTFRLAVTSACRLTTTV